VPIKLRNRCTVRKIMKAWFGKQSAFSNCIRMLRWQKAFQQLLDRYPNSPLRERALYAIGDAYYNGGQYEQAIEAYQQFVSPDADRAAEALFWLAKSYASMAEGTVRSQLLHQADSLLQVLIQRYPRSPVALRAQFERGTIGHSSGFSPVSAAGNPICQYGFWSAQPVPPGGVLPRSERIRAGTAGICEAAAEAQYWIGELWLREKNYAAAAKAFQQVKRRFAEYERWYVLSLLNLGYCYEKMEQWDLAAEQYRLVLALRSDDEFARTARSRLEKLRSKMQ